MNIFADGDLKKIISNFQFLFPEDTSAEELDILFNTKVDVFKIEDRPAVFNLVFYTTTINYKYIKPNIGSIEENLKRKAELIFKWFPACKIEQVIIKPI